MMVRKAIALLLVFVHLLAVWAVVLPVSAAEADPRISDPAELPLGRDGVILSDAPPVVSSSERGPFSAVTIGGWTVMINREMADRISPADLLPKADADAEARENSVTVYSMDEAVKAVRAAMVGRKSSVFVEIVNDHAPYDDHYAWFLAEYEKWKEETRANLASKVMAHTGVPYEGDYLRYQMTKWLFSVGTDGKVVEGNLVTCIECKFRDSYFTDAEDEEQMNIRVAEVVKSFPFTSKTTTYEKVKTIHNWICANVTYDHKNLNNTEYLRKHSAAAALLDGTAVCQGYAILFYRLCLECGVDARYISGTGDNGDEVGPHGWNIVDPGDGRYYYLDTTWDSPYFWIGRKSDFYVYFLKGSRNFTKDHTPGEGVLEALGPKFAVSEEDYDLSAGTVLVGDADDNGFVEAADLMILSRYLSGWEGYGGMILNTAAADLSGDGNTRALDRMMLARYLKGFNANAARSPQ